jgi:hypothetical protein
LRVSNKDWTEEFCYQEDTRIVAANQSRGGRSKAVWIQGPRYEDQGAATAEAAPAVSQPFIVLAQDYFGKHA